MIRRERGKEEQSRAIVGGRSRISGEISGRRR